MNKKQRKKRGKTKPPSDMQRTIIMSLLAHGILIVAFVALGWHEFAVETPGTAIFVHAVAMGGDDGGPGAVAAPLENSPPTPQPAAPKAKTSAPLAAPSPAVTKNAPHESPSTTGDHNSTQDSADGNGSGAGTADGTGPGAGNGSGHGGAGNPILAEIRRRIEQAKRYPNPARQQHLEGKVGLHFLIQSNGQVGTVRITRSSGAPILDDAAIQAVRHSAPLPYYEGPIEFSLGFHLR